MGHHTSNIYSCSNLMFNNLLQYFLMMRLILSHLIHTPATSLTVIARKTRCATFCNALARFSSCNQDDDMSKIGINGFGRIGRLVLRASLERGGQVRWKESVERRQSANRFHTRFTNPIFLPSRSSPSMTPSSVSITWSTCSSMTPPTVNSRERSKPRTIVSS